MRMFGEITKVEAQDDGTIKVVGIASSGTPGPRRIHPDFASSIHR